MAVVVAHPRIEKWAHYDYIAEVRVKAGDVVARGETLGWVVRPGHVRSVAPGRWWVGRVSMDVCDAPCDGAREAFAGYRAVCMHQAQPGDVIFPVVC